MVKGLLAAIVAAFSPSAAIAQVPPESAELALRPIGRWVVDHDDWRCIARREYDAGGRHALFSITREPVTRTSWIRLRTEGRARRRADGEAVMFADGRRSPEAMHYNYFQEDGPYEVREYMTNLDQHSLTSVQRRLRFWTRNHGDIELDLTGFPAAHSALETCMADLYETFGVSARDLAQVAIQPQGSSLQFSQHSIGREFNIVLFYWVTSTGRVEGCRLLQPSGIAALDANICNDLHTKAHFEPARNSAGQPIRAPVFENTRIRQAIVRTRRRLHGN